MTKVLNFSKYRGLAIILSLTAVVAMFVLTFVLNEGFNLGVDFKPGVVVTVKINADANTEIVRKALATEKSIQIQTSGPAESKTFIIRESGYDATKENFTSEVRAKIEQLLNTAFGTGSITILQTISVGAQQSATLTQMAILLVALAMIFIMIYIWFRFKLGYAMGALASTFMNTLFMIGFVGVTQTEISVSVIAAMLTIIGYALNDTIVVFDRIRENEKTMSGNGIGFIIDTSISQTLSRTIVTSFTVLLSVVAIFIFTEGVIKDFAFVMIFGVIIGTFSSIYIASTILLEWRALESRRKKKVDGGDKTSDTEIASTEEKPNESFDVDAEAIADQLRRERTDKKKF